MRVFVTGASGFVGRRLVPRLRAAGHETTGADREVDVTSADAIAKALETHAPDAVVHLAALSSVAESWSDPDLCHRTNFLGTRTLLEAVERLRPACRVLLIGSGDQYAPTSPRSRPLDESTALRPRSPYAKAKAEAEALGSRLAAQGMDIVRVRAFNHTGAGQSDRFVVPSFARQLAEMRRGLRPARLRVGNLASVRDFLHVDDVVEAYRRLLDPSVPADVYNVASGRGHSIRAVLDRLLEISGLEPEIVIDPDRWRDTDWLVGDPGRLERATGWAARVTLDELLRELYEDWLVRSEAA